MLNYSMCPGGAMMICESISEYDANVAAPPAPAPEVVIKQAEEMDPVVKVKGKLGEIYKTQIEPLLSMSLDGSRSGEALTIDLDRLNYIVSTVFEKLVMMAVKASCISKAFNGGDKELLKLEFNSHRGLFIRKSETVHQQGIERFSYNQTNFPGVCDWSTERVINDVISHLDEYSNSTITKEIIVGMQGADTGSLGKSFTGFRDFNDCVFSDFDRYARLETSFNDTLDFDWMIRQENLERCCIDEPGRYETVTKLTCCISQFIRKTKCSIYDMSNAIIDGNMTPDWYQCEVKKIITNMYNLFTVATIYIFREAYRVRNALEYKNAVKNYTDLLLKTLKTV